MHEDNVSMNGNITLGQMRNRAQGHERISIRTQRKVYWRLFGWYAGFSPLPYQRFKDLCLRSCPAESEQERLFWLELKSILPPLARLRMIPSFTWMTGFQWKKLYRSLFPPSQVVRWQESAD